MQQISECLLLPGTIGGSEQTVMNKTDIGNIKNISMKLLLLLL